MRVLHVYKAYYPDSVGGIEQVVYQLARGLGALGHENRIVTLSRGCNPPVIARAEGDVHRFRTTLEVASNPVSLSALAGFGRELAWADVVHYQFPWPFADVLHLSRRTRRPTVVTYQSDIVRQRGWMWAYAPLMNRFLARVDAVVATSPNYLASSPVLGSLGRPVDIVPNGMDAATLPAADAATRARWRAELGEGFFLFVGVLRYYKGVETLLRAADQVNVPIVIVGAGPEEARLHALTHQLGVRNVRFLGEVSDADKSALYALAGSFVFPSHLRSEAFGMSLVEASMFGKPMVTCEIGTGTSFINLDGVTGLTVPPGDPRALAQAMNALAAAPDLRARFGRAARARYESLLTAEAMARSYAEIYQRLTNTPGGPSSAAA